MTSPVFFSTGAAPSSGSSRNLVEFKAGKMELRDKTVHPLKKKGLVYLRQSPDDNLMHFCWRDRQTGIVEDDLILFPDDCEFKKVKECTTGRVYVLKMKSSNKKMFFWMQEPQSESDDDHCKRINEMLNNPPRAGSDTSSSADRDLQSIFSNMTQEQMAQLLSSNGVNLASLLNAAGRSPSSNSGTSLSSTASTTNSSAPVSASQPTSAHGAAGSGSHDVSASNITDFRNLLSSALIDGNEEEAEALVAATLGRGVDPGSSRIQQRDSQSSVMIDLSHAINSESLAHLLNDSDFIRHIEPHLPNIRVSDQPMDLEDAKKETSNTIRSSQFRSSLSQFSTALQSGQLGPLMSQFGLNQACVDAANLGNLEAFVRALESQMSSSSDSSNTPNKPADDGSRTPSEPKGKK